MPKDGKIVIGEVQIKCPACGCEILSTPMPVGKIMYFKGRSLITNQPDFQMHDAEMAFICTRCGKFVYLKPKVSDMENSGILS